MINAMLLKYGIVWWFWRWVAFELEIDSRIMFNGYAKRLLQVNAWWRRWQFHKISTIGNNSLPKRNAKTVPRKGRRRSTTAGNRRRRKGERRGREVRERRERRGSVRLMMNQSLRWSANLTRIVLSAIFPPLSLIARAKCSLFSQIPNPMPLEKPF